MRKATAVVLVIVFVFALSACERNPEEKDELGGSDTFADSVEQSQPYEYKELYTAPYNFDFLSNPWKNKWFSIIDGKYAKLADPEKIIEFQSQFDENGGDKTFEEYNMYNFVKFTGIKKEDFIRINGNSDNYTDEEIEMMFAEDKTKEEVYNYFAEPHAIISDGKAYTVSWLWEHRYYDYQKAGMTSRMLEEKLPIIEEALHSIMDPTLQLMSIKGNISDLKSVEEDPDVFKKDCKYYRWIYHSYYLFRYPWKNPAFGGVTFDLASIYPENEINSYFEKVRYNDENVEGYYHTVYDFIKAFNVSKTVFIENLGYLYTEEEIDMIYAEDKTKEEIYAYFLAPYIITIDGNYYTIDWLCSHDAEDYTNAGITLKILDEKLPFIKEHISLNYEDSKADYIESVREILRASVK